MRDDTDAWEDCSGDDERWDALVRGREPLANGSRLEVGVPSRELAAWNVSIVDTPGMNTDVPELEARAWAAAAAAPVVVVTIPAESAGRTTDIDCLDAMGANSASAVIVLTKVDQVPEGAAPRIVARFQELLGRRGISPLAIVAASATGTGDDERWGIAAVRRVLAEVTGARRNHLVAHHAGGSVTTKLRSELSALRLERAVLESEASAMQERGRGEVADIEADTADREAEFKQEIERLRDRGRRLRAEAFNGMYEVGERILQAISEEIAPLRTRQNVQRFADGPVRRHVLEWRAACIAAAEDGFAALEQAGSEAARQAASRHFEQQGIATDWLQALPETTGAHDSDREPGYVENLRRDRADLLNRIEDLKGQAPASDTLAEIEQALSAAKQERGELVYEPRMDVVRLDQGKQQFAEAGRVLGKIADVALIVTPIPIGGKFGMALKSLRGGQTLVRGIQRYNTLIGHRDRWLRSLLPTAPTRAAPPVDAPGRLSKALGNLSLETWGERLGSSVGGLINPDREVEVENQEVRQEFLQRRKPYDDTIHHLEHERSVVRLQQQRVERQIRQERAEQERVDRLLQEGEELERRRKALDAEHDAARAKTALMAQLVRQFHDRRGDTLFSDLRNAVDAGFDSAREAVEEDLRERVSRIESEAQAALQTAQAKRTQGETAVEEALEKNRTMCEALQAALSILETA